MHQESEQNYASLFEAAEVLWKECCPERPPLQQCVRQLHKDFAPGIEAARRVAFPQSRPCNDWFHLKRKRAEIAARCKQVKHVNGKFEKLNASWVMSCLEHLRLTPTKALMIELWAAFLRRLRALKEEAVAAWLRQHYTCADGTASFWVGAFGVHSGTGSGNEPAEAVHAAWQRQLEALGGKGNVVTSLTVLQKLYRTWRRLYCWESDSALSCLPEKTDPSMLAGETLARAGRSTAKELFAAHTAGVPMQYHLRWSDGEHLAAFAQSLSETALLDAAAAIHGLRVLTAASDEARRESLRHAGVLQPDGSDLVFSLAGYRRTFGQACYVWVPAQGRLTASCRSFSLYADCEHCLCAQAMTWPARARSIDFARKKKKTSKAGLVEKAKDPARIRIAGCAEAKASVQQEERKRRRT